MSKFAQDYNVFFEFHSYSNFMKDWDFRIMLLEAMVKDDFYVFFISLKLMSIISVSSLLQLLIYSILTKIFNFFIVSTLSCCCSIYELWHNRFGHPLEKIVKNVLSMCQIP